MRHLRPLSAAAALGLCLSATPAAAQDPGGGGPTNPGADSFDIRYFLTDGEGNRVRQMTPNDMRYFVNKARCECGQKIDSQVRLLSTQTTYNQIQITGYIGTQCSTAETSFNPQFKRCAQFTAASTTAFLSNQGTAFAPIWLTSGVDNISEMAGVDERNPETAIPAGTCDGAPGEGGIWLCGQTDSVAGCQSEEFFITGTQNKNFTDGSSSQGITVDYQPPLSLPTDLSALVGDGAVVVSWNLPAGGGDAYGFRVLCEEAESGEPAVTGVVSDPGVAANTYGTIYYTKENLCPGGAFWTPAGQSDTSGGTTTTDGSTTDATTGTTDTTGTSTGTSTTDTSTTDATTTGGDTGGDTPVSTVCPDERPESGICSLRWDYVCTGHLAGNTKSTRVTGLENGKRYNFLLLAYDQAGNPISVGKIENVAPVETNDLWEQCEADGDICGDSGFCAVDREARGSGGAAFAFVIGLGLAAARRRRWIRKIP